MRTEILDKSSSLTNNLKDSVQSEIQEYLNISQQRRWIFPRAMLVGVCAGIVALLFRAALTIADNVRNELISWAHNFPILGWIFPK